MAQVNRPARRRALPPRPPSHFQARNSASRALCLARSPRRPLAASAAAAASLHTKDCYPLSSFSTSTSSSGDSRAPTAGLGRGGGGGAGRTYYSQHPSIRGGGGGFFFFSLSPKKIFFFCPFHRFAFLWFHPPLLSLPPPPPVNKSPTAPANK